MNSDANLTTIHFDGSVSKEIFLRLQYLHLGWRRYVGFLTALLLIAVFWIGNQDLFLKVSTTISAIAVAVVLFWWQRFSLLRLYKKSPYLQESLKGEVSTVGLALESTTGQSHLHWNDFIKSKFSEDIVLLYRGPNVMNFLAKEFFSNEEDWQQVKEIIRDRIIKK